MDDPFLLWSRALRGLALIVLLIFFLGGWVVDLWLAVDLGGSWRSLLVPLSLSLLLWLASWLLGRQAKARRSE